MTGSTLEDVYRGEVPHVVAALVRRYGHFGEAEDAVQEALAAAVVQWPGDGVPENPRAWLIRVASRRLVDQLRSAESRAAREQVVGVSQPADADLSAPADAGPEAVDDSLTVLFLCCHPALSRASQVALTLRAVGGLNTAQVAAAFLVPEATMAQRISRAKTTLRAAGARFTPPSAEELPSRVAAVLDVLYLIFNEGYASSGGRFLLDVSLSHEAIRLTRRLCRLLLHHDEVAGALALMLLTHARTATRTDEHGDLVPLAEQDRTRWDRAAVHAEASTWPDTDWEQIAVLYRMLHELAPSPTVTLNRAVAVGMAHRPEDGLALLDPLSTMPAMQRNHRLYAVRAHLLEMADRPSEAAADYARAAQLTASIPEQRYLNARTERARRR
jgi:RNA polymerase sigma factor (sigma-70 family)